ncbi:MAG: sensor histidine kinase [Methanothermobacter sp.]|nr:sensor histidine kinase [Methanothermobacter sp.]
MKTAKTYWEEEECTLISIRDITKIKEYEKSLEKSLREKNTMLAELHHRVKNNLQVIISLIDLQKRHMKSPEDKEQIEKVNNRIKAIARAHERLYLAEDLSSIDLKDYLEDILLELKATYQKPGIQFECQIQDIKLNINQAIPCGLIINEALTNTMKHAFPEGEGRVIIKAYKKDNLININIEDNGVGLPENFKPEETLGMRIMHALTRQLDGEIRIKGEKGVKIRLRFPHPQNRG